MKHGIIQALHALVFNTTYTHTWESISRQVDEKSGISKRGEGSAILKEEERTNAFFFPPLSTFISLSHIKLFSVSPELMITQQTTQF